MHTVKVPRLPSESAGEDYNAHMQRSSSSVNCFRKNTPGVLFCSWRGCQKLPENSRDRLLGQMQVTRGCEVMKYLLELLLPLSTGTHIPETLLYLFTARPL